MNPQELLMGAQSIAEKTGRWLQSARPDSRVKVIDTKSSARDVVTALDRQTEARIIESLLAWRPDDGIIAEESGISEGTSGIEWVIDPIDGTVNFIYGIGSSAISIAARHEGVEVVGVVFDLVTGALYSAALDAGSHVTQGGKVRQLSGPAPVPPAEMLVATGFHYTTDVRLRQARAVANLLPHIRDIRRLGAASLDLVAVADGRLDSYVEEGLKPWDHAAAGLIAREAGLVVRGLDAEPDERLVIAAHPEQSEVFLNLLKDCGF